MMDLQTAFNLAVAVCGFLGGWVLNTMWNAIKDMQTADKVVIDRVSSLEVHVAGRYVTRAELEKLMSRFDDKLDTILGKLDGKADK